MPTLGLLGETVFTYSHQGAALNTQIHQRVFVILSDGNREMSLPCRAPVSLQTAKSQMNLALEGIGGLFRGDRVRFRRRLWSCSERWLGGRAAEGGLGSDLTLPTACWLCLRFSI